MLLKSFAIAASLIGALAFTPVTIADTKTANPNASVAQQQQMSTKVNINSADAAVMAERLNGIGEKKAQAIVEHREKNGPFKSVDDLKNVSGIGDATLEKNRDLLTVE